jgi:hypothetical protein
MDRPPSLSFGHMRARDRRFSYDATLGVQMQVHLHRTDKICYGNPAQGRPGETHRFQSTVAEKTGGRVGALPQKEMNDGSDAKRRAALAAESREMAEEQSQ